MAESKVYEVVIKGITTSIRNVSDLNSAIKKVNNEFKNSDFGSDKFKGLQKTLGQLKGVQSDITKSTRTLAQSNNVAANSMLGLTLKSKELKTALSVLDPNTSEYKKYQKELAATALQQKKLRDSTRQLTRDLEEQEVDPTSLRGFELQYSRLRGEIKKLSAEERKSDFGKNLIRQAAKSRAEVTRLNKELNDFGANVGNYKSGINGLAGGFKNLALTFGIGFGLSELTQVAKSGIKIFADFGQQIATLGAISGATKEELALLKSQAIEVGSSTQFTATQVAEMQTALARLGFSTDEILKSTSAVSNIAIATGEDLGEVAKVVGQTIRAYGLSADESQRVSDVLAASFNSSALQLSTFAEASKLLAPVSKVLGVSIEESSAAIGLLADNGLEGTIATQTLGTALQKLADPTKKFAEAADNLGVEIFDKNGQFVGLTQVIDNLNEATKDMTEQDRLAAVSQIFGQQAAKNFTILLTGQKEVVTENGKELLTGANALRAYTDELNKSGGAAEETAAKVGDTLAQDFLKLQSAIEGATIKLLESKEGGLRDFVQGLTELTPELIKNIELIFEFAQGIQDASADINSMINTLSNVGVAFGFIEEGAESSLNIVSILSDSVTGFGVSLSDIGNSILGGGFIKSLKLITDNIQGILNSVDFLEKRLAGSSVGDFLGFKLDAFEAPKGDTIFDLLRKANAKLSSDLEKSNNEGDKAVDNYDKQTNALEKLRKKQEELKKSIIDAVDNKDTERVASLRDEYKKVSKEIEVFNDALNFTDDTVMKLTEGSLAFFEAEISRINNEIKNADPSVYDELSQELIANETKAKALREELERIKKAFSAIGEIKEVPVFDLSSTDATVKPQASAEPEEDFTEDLLKRNIKKQKEFLELSKLEQLESDKLILDEKLASSQYEFDEKLRFADELAAKEIEIEREKEAQKAQIRSESFEQVKGILEGIQQGISFVQDIADIRNQRQLNQIEATYERDLELAGDNAEEKEKAEEKYAAAKKKLDKDVFEQNKKIAITQALINGALAITNILATVPKADFGIATAIMTAAAVATTAVQVATIASQKFKGERGLSFSKKDIQAFAVSDYSDIPKAASGGTVTLGGFAKGKRHSQGGIKASFYGVPVEIEDNEFVDVLEDGGIAVINRKSSSMFASEFRQMAGKKFEGKRNLYSQMNQAGGGVAFELGGVVRPVTPNVAALGRESLRKQGVEVSVKIDATEATNRMADGIREELSEFAELPSAIQKSIKTSMREISDEIKESLLNKNEEE